MAVRLETGRSSDAKRSEGKPVRQMMRSIRKRRIIIMFAPDSAVCLKARGWDLTSSALATPRVCMDVVLSLYDRDQ